MVAGSGFFTDAYDTFSINMGMMRWFAADDSEYATRVRLLPRRDAPGNDAHQSRRGIKSGYQCRGHHRPTHLWLPLRQTRP
jgi:hypothetical protein